MTNIDNFLRPILVPREARLDSALMLLSVFAGIAMFGAFGIVIGPVLMIVIVTTISVYLAVYKGVPLEQQEDDDTERVQRKEERAATLDAQGQEVRTGRARTREQRSAGKGLRPLSQPLLRNSTTRLRAS